MTISRSYHDVNANKVHGAPLPGVRCRVPSISSRPPAPTVLTRDPEQLLELELVDQVELGEKRELDAIDCGLIERAKQAGKKKQTRKSNSGAAIAGDANGASQGRIGT